MATAVQICNAALGRIGVRDLIQDLSDNSVQANLCTAFFSVNLDTLTELMPWKFAEKHAQVTLVAPPYPAWSAMTTYAQGQQVTVSGQPGFYTSLVANNLNNNPVTDSGANWQNTPIYSRTGWNYMYTLPADYIAARGIQFQLNHGISGPFVPSPPTPQPWWLREQDPHFREAFDTGASDDGTGIVLLTNMVAAEIIYTASVQTRGNWPPLFSDALMWMMARDLAMAIPNKLPVALKMEEKFQAALLTAGASSLNQQYQPEPESEFILSRG